MPSGVEHSSYRPDSRPMDRETSRGRPGVQNGRPGWLIFGVPRTGVVADLM